MAFTIKGSINSSDKTYLYSEIEHKTRSTKSDKQNYKKIPALVEWGLSLC